MKVKLYSLTAEMYVKLTEYVANHEHAKEVIYFNEKRKRPEVRFTPLINISAVELDDNQGRLNVEVIFFDKVLTLECQKAYCFNMKKTIRTLPAGTTSGQFEEKLRNDEVGEFDFVTVQGHEEMRHETLEIDQVDVPTYQTKLKIVPLNPEDLMSCLEYQFTNRRPFVIDGGEHCS